MPCDSSNPCWRQALCLIAERRCRWGGLLGDGGIGSCGVADRLGRVLPHLQRPPGHYICQLFQFSLALSRALQCAEQRQLRTRLAQVGTSRVTIS